MINILIVFSLFLTISCKKETDNNTIQITPEWKILKDMPQPGQAITVWSGKRLFIINSNWNLNFSGNLAEYDFKQDSCFEKAKIPTTRYGFNAVAVNNKIYVLGGVVDDSETRTEVVEEYDISTDKWTTKAPMFTKRSDFLITEYNNKIYVFGGLVPNGAKIEDSKTFEIYDIASNSWTKKPDMTTARTYGYTGIINNKMYFTHSNTFDVYDPVADKWSSSSSGSTVQIVRSAIYKNEIYTCHRNWGPNTKTYFNKYNPETDSWTKLKDPIVDKMDFNYAVFQDKILVFGGWVNNEYWKAVNSCEMYDIKEDKWSNISPMAVPRVEMTVVTTDKGIYVFGGMDGYKYTTNDILDKANIIIYSKKEFLQMSK